MSLKDDVIKYYAARAPVHDESSGYTNPEAEKLRIPIKKRYQEIFRGRDVLEIACGTGYWTAVIGETAKSVLAIDVSRELLSIAADRCKNLPNVYLKIADAYKLKGVPAGFNAAFGRWWWSHIPRADIKKFLVSLHSKLAPGALVMFVDQLPYDGFVRKQDKEGNTLEQRSLPGGKSCLIVKNFPTRQEIMETLKGIANDIKFTGRTDEQSWEVIYRVKGIG